jgi:LacI family transcriptional regulator
MGQQAAELLIKRIEHVSQGEFKKEVISTNLKIRRSTLSVD